MSDAIGILVPVPGNKEEETYSFAQSGETFAVPIKNTGSIYKIVATDILGIELESWYSPSSEP